MPRLSSSFRSNFFRRFYEMFPNPQSKKHWKIIRERSSLQVLGNSFVMKRFGIESIHNYLELCFTRQLLRLWYINRYQQSCRFPSNYLNFGEFYCKECNINNIRYCWVANYKLLSIITKKIFKSSII